MRGVCPLRERGADPKADPQIPGRVELEAVLGHAGAHPLQARVHPRQLVVVEDADPAQAARVGPRLVDVVDRQLPVEGQRAVHPPEAWS